MVCFVQSIAPEFEVTHLCLYVLQNTGLFGREHWGSADSEVCDGIDRGACRAHPSYVASRTAGSHRARHLLVPKTTEQQHFFL